jgi:O-antigen ligase
MKEMFIIEDSLPNKISYYLLLAFVITLPFDLFYNQMVLIGFLVHTTIHLKKANIRSISIHTWILSSLFLLTIITTIYSIDKARAFRDWEKQLALLLFPLALSVTSLDLKKYKTRLLIGFSGICVLTVLYLYNDAFHIIRYSQLPISSLFSIAFINHNFSSPIEMHATYLSMYLALSISTLLYLLLKSRTRNSRILIIIATGILAAGLFQLSSRAVFIAINIIIFIIPWYSASPVYRKKMLLGASIVTAIAVFAIIQIDSFKNRYVVEFKNDLSEFSFNNDILEPRITRWASAWELIKKSPLIGYGSGSETVVLKEKYFEEKLYNSYLNELNAHNQYISFWLKSGIFGLVLYLYLLYYGFSNAFRSRDAVFLSFLIIITIVSFSENILDVNKGIFFFGFFFSLFILSDKSDSKGSNQPI